MTWAGPVLTTLTTVERVRWGIIGVGNVTERKSGPGFQQAERSELVAVMRRNGDLAADTLDDTTSPIGTTMPTS